MSSQTSLVAKNYRLQQWAAQVQDCQNRPEEMLVDDWCRQNNITKATYYYRLKCVRQACLNSLPESATSFVELPPPIAQPAASAIASGTTDISAIIRAKDGISIELYDSASSDFIQKIIGVLVRAE